MNGGGAGLQEHILESSFPHFLAELESTPEKAWAEFHVFTWKLLTAYPPPVFRELPRETRDDIAADIVIACRLDNFRLLRNYEDRGVAFAAWVARMARNRALDHVRHAEVAGRATPPSTAPTPPPPDDHASHRELLAAVREALQQLGLRCRLLLEAAADELKPAEIALLMGDPGQDGKKVSDALRACRRTLRHLLRRRGIEPALGGTAGGEI